MTSYINVNAPLVVPANSTDEVRKKGRKKKRAAKRKRERERGGEEITNSRIHLSGEDEQKKKKRENKTL